MYAKEFEDLLKEYLTDGIITSKEREVLLKKAQQLGYDVDEVDLYIDAQVQKIEHEEKNIREKTMGRKCPLCGSHIVSGIRKCPDCGFDFGVLTSSSQMLTEAIKISRGYSYENKEKFNINSPDEIIDAFPIPEDRREFIDFSRTVLFNLSEIKIDSAHGADDTDEAWEKKGRELIMKAEVLFPHDENIQSLMKQIQNKIDSIKRAEKKAEKKENRVITLIGIAYLAIPIAFGYFVIKWIISCVH